MITDTQPMQMSAQEAVLKLDVGGDQRRLLAQTSLRGLRQANCCRARIGLGTPIQS